MRKKTPRKRYNLAWHRRLKRHRACREAREWASRYESLQTAWSLCQRPSWMCWYLWKSGAAIGSYLSYQWSTLTPRQIRKVYPTPPKLHDPQ